MEILFSHITDELQAGYIECGKYPNGNLAVQLNTADEPYATLSINVDYANINKNEFVAKIFDENEGLNEQLLKDGIFSDTGKTCFVSGRARCPIYTVN